MRASGWVDSARGLFPDGHLCWTFRDRAAFRHQAAEYAADSLAGGYWVEYVGDGTADDLRNELAAIDGLSEAAEAGRAGVCPVEEFYRLDAQGLIDPAASVAARVDATESAIARGFAGFRAIVDCTAVARTPRQRDAFGRFEFLIDRQMCRLPVSAMCSYDRGVLGPEAVAAMASLHPFARRGATPFRLHADPNYALSIGGEVDFAGRALFERALSFAEEVRFDDEMVIDGTNLTFLDHRAILSLDSLAQRQGTKAVLLTRQGATARVADLVNAEHIRVEQVA